MSLFQDQENTSRFICKVNDTLIRVSEGENIRWTAPLRFGETETQPLPLAAGSYPLTSAARARGNRTLTALTTCFTQVTTLLLGDDEQADKTVDTLIDTMWTQAGTEAVQLHLNLSLSPMHFPLLSN